MRLQLQSKSFLIFTSADICYGIIFTEKNHVYLYKNLLQKYSNSWTTKKKRDEQKYTDSIWPEYKGKNKQREETPLWS